MDFSLTAELPTLLLVGGHPVIQVSFHSTEGKINDKGQIEGFVDASRSQPATPSKLDIAIPFSHLLNAAIITGNGRYRKGHLIFKSDLRPLMEATRQELLRLAHDIEQFRYE